MSRSKFTPRALIVLAAVALLFQWFSRQALLRSEAVLRSASEGVTVDL